MVRESLRQRVAALLLLCAALMLLVPRVAFADTQEVTRSRAIAIAYDNSGSMSYSPSSDKHFDKWCNAKYSVEVLAAMLDEGDTLEVHLMNGASQVVNPPLRLRGSDSVDARVSAVHNWEFNMSGCTSPKAAKDALDSLKSSNAKEKWLIITTDGKFNADMNNEENISEADSLDLVRGVVRDARAQNIRVIYLAIGNQPDMLDASDGVIPEHAKSSEILTRMTEIANIVFGRSEVPYSGGNLSLDIPMSKLIVFAQGANVEVGSLEGPSGSISAHQATVSYTEKPYSDQDGDHNESWAGIVNENLHGVVATYDAKLLRGDYRLDVQGADEVSVYYIPRVDIALTLTDHDLGQTYDLAPGVTEKVYAGDFTSTFAIIDPDDGSDVSGSSLLSNARYTITVDQGGGPQQIANNEAIHLDPGTATFEIECFVPEGDSEDAGLRFHNTYTTEVGPLLGKLVVDADAVPTSADIRDLPASSGTLRITHGDGSPLTADEWERLKLKAKNDKDLVWTLEKGDEVGVVTVALSYGGEDPLAVSKRILGGGLFGGYRPKDVTTQFTATIDDPERPFGGNAEVTTTIQPDVLGTFLRNLVWYLLIALTAFLITCFVTKPRLPKLSPRLEVNGKTYKLQYNGRVEHRIMLPWSPETTRFSTRLSSGKTNKYAKKFKQMEIGLVAVRGGRFRLDDQTVAALAKYQETPGKFPDPELTCLKRAGDKKGKVKYESKVFGRGSSITIEGHPENDNRRIGTDTYTIRFS